MISQARLKELLDYDPETGVFTWRIQRQYVHPGDKAGSVSSEGYVVIGCDQRVYKAHRLAWLYVTGNEPRHQIDHINGVKNDNRLANLREATHSQNQFNTSKRVTESKLPRGVTESNNGYQARIGYGTKRIYLGYFKCPAAASFAYQIAADKMHGEFTGDIL
jgi:hypothetical protein